MSNFLGVKHFNRRGRGGGASEPSGGEKCGINEIV